MNNPSNTPIFFILGRERSGTTMLRVTLNNHPAIHIPPESPFILQLYRKYNGKNNINVAQFINDLKLDPFLRIWDINYNLLKNKLTQIQPSNFQLFCKLILSQQKSHQVLGDKNPTYSLFGSTLRNIFPEAKFIWIIRDYRAQVNSMLKVNFEKKIISSLATRWVSYNSSIEQLKNKFPKQVLLMKYEDLVENPESNYRIICNFLNVEFDLSVLKIELIKKEFYPKHHISLDDNINTTHVDEWKSQLTPKQIKLCEAIAGNYGEKFGYQKTNISSPLIYWSALFGILYGKCYRYFILFMYKLPLKVRTFINYKIIYKNSSFWKELEKNFKN